MSTLKLSGLNSGSSIIKAPDSGSTGVTFTLPASAGTLATTADNGSQLDHSGTKKIEATSTGASVVGVGKFFLENNGGAGGGIVASNTNASNPAMGGFLDLMERDVNFGTANNYGVRLYYDGSTNKFHIQGGNETTVATHLTMVRDSGEITIDTGDLIFGTAGKGIVLGNTSNTDANTLDDYEEGTYNAVISGSTSGTFNMDSNDTLAYTKVGRIVSVQGYIGVSSGSVSGNLRMTLPFTPTSLPDDAQYNFSSLMIQNTGNTNSGQKYLFLTGDAYGWFYKVEDSGSAGYMHNNDVDSAFQVAVSFTYISG